MSKKIRNLLSEIDKKFKDSEEVSLSLLFIKKSNSDWSISLCLEHIYHLWHLLIGYLNNRYFAIQIRECTNLKSKGKVRIRNEEGNKKAIEAQRLF